jgi:hypothetical protein
METYHQLAASQVWAWSWKQKQEKATAAQRRSPAAAGCREIPATRRLRDSRVTIVIVTDEDDAGEHEYEQEYVEGPRRRCSSASSLPAVSSASP